MTNSSRPRILLGTAALGALLALGACDASRPFDLDMRGDAGGPLDTSGAALQATDRRPQPDARGVLSYPGYQVAVARRGDTARTVATRVGIDADELARTNAVIPDDPLRAGEVLALPRRVAGGAAPLGVTGVGSGAISGGTIAPAPVDVTSIATTALDRTTPSAAASTATQPGRHRVARGETAFSIARLYGVSTQALAEWNGLGTDLKVREGQYLLIPTAQAGSKPVAERLTAPGAGSPTPIPPSSREPLPTEKTAPASAAVENVPASPDLGKDRTSASAARFALPVQGRIIRSYAKGKNEGIDISAAAGSTVSAAADGTVAAVTKDTGQVPILVLRHDGNLLTVYAGIDAVKVAKGATVKRGQPIAVVRSGNPAFVHFEVRKGVASVDPMTMLQ